MTITRMDTKQRMSRIVIHNDTIYLCGHVAEDANKGIEIQTQTMIGSEGAEAPVCPQNRAYGSVHGSSCHSYPLTERKPMLKLII